MKLRIRGNTIRIRVTQSELTDLDQKGEIRDSIQFPGQVLTYLVKKADVSAVGAHMDEGTICIVLPAIVASEWTSTDLVTINGTQQNGNDLLEILVEKDFKCLDERQGEDESDLFPNPKKVC